MWICLNNAFLSIVEPARTARGSSLVLLVRARREGDIEKVFPMAAVETIDRRDYQFRAVIARDVVAKAMLDAVMGINYGNFKDSVIDNKLHEAYASVWGVMSRLQPQRPYSDYSRAQRASRQQSIPLSSLSAAELKVSVTPAMRKLCWRLLDAKRCTLKRSNRTGSHSVSGYDSRGCPTYDFVDRMEQAGLITFAADGSQYEIAQLTELGRKEARA